LHRGDLPLRERKITAKITDDAPLVRVFPAPCVCCSGLIKV
jgi:hypothetical protein